MSKKNNIIILPHTPSTKRMYVAMPLGKEKKLSQKTLHNDKVNHPSHYTWLKNLCGIEVIDITRHLNFNLGNCLKYLLRAGHKFEKGMNAKEKHIEDLKKAEFYIKDEIKRLEEEK